MSNLKKNAFLEEPVVLRKTGVKGGMVSVMPTGTLMNSYYGSGYSVLSHSLSTEESVLKYLDSVDPWRKLGFGSRKEVKEMITNAKPDYSGISKAGFQLLFDLLGINSLKFPLICKGSSVDRINDLEHPRQDVRRAAAVELVNIEVDSKSKASALKSFLGLPVTNTNTSTETYVLLRAAKFLLNKGKTVSLLYHMVVLFMIELKSCPDGLPTQGPSTNGGSQTPNPQAGPSNVASVSGFNVTGPPPPRGALRGQGDDGDDNDDNNFNVYRGPAVILSGQGWLRLFVVVLTIVLELLGLFAALSQADGNTATVLFSVDNIIVIGLVAVLTAMILLLVYLFVKLAHRPTIRANNSSNHQP